MHLTIQKLSRLYFVLKNKDALTLWLTLPPQQASELS